MLFAGTAIRRRFRLLGSPGRRLRNRRLGNDGWRRLLLLATSATRATGWANWRWPRSASSILRSSHPTACACSKAAGFRLADVHDHGDLARRSPPAQLGVRASKSRWLGFWVRGPAQSCSRYRRLTSGERSPRALTLQLQFQRTLRERIVIRRSRHGRTAHRPRGRHHGTGCRDIRVVARCGFVDGPTRSPLCMARAGLAFERTTVYIFGRDTPIVTGKGIRHVAQRLFALMATTVSSHIGFRRAESSAARVGSRRVLMLLGRFVGNAVDSQSGFGDSCSGAVTRSARSSGADCARLRATAVSLPTGPQASRISCPWVTIIPACRAGFRARDTRAASNEPRRLCHVPADAPDRLDLPSCNNGSSLHRARSGATQLARAPSGALKGLVTSRQHVQRGFLRLHRSRRARRSFHDHAHRESPRPSPSGSPRSTSNKSGRWLRASMTGTQRFAASTTQLTRPAATRSVTLPGRPRCEDQCIAWVMTVRVSNVNCNRAPPPGWSPSRYIPAMCCDRDRSPARSCTADRALS